MRLSKTKIAAATSLLLLIYEFSFGQRQMENIDRGLTAVYQGQNTMFLSWRMLGTEPANAAYNLYRSENGGKPIKLNRGPLDKGTNFVDENVDPTGQNAYFVRPVVNGKEGDPSRSFTVKANPEVRQYFSVPLQTPENYTPNDASVGDVDGDGQYEIILHQVGRGRDNSHTGMTTPPILEAYELDGTLLWRINLGKNIREGAHYTQFMVYDFDGDGKAEVACKTADGTVDGQGKVIGDANADYVEPEGSTIKLRGRGGREFEREVTGYILSGPEYLTVFEGATGAELATVDYIPPRHPDTTDPTPEQMDELWGDGYGNRVDRFLAGVAYLDGKRPSLVMARGYYTRSVLSAWNFRDGELTHVWTFDSEDGTSGNKAYSGQGNHSLSVADVDNDGKDEIIYGAAAIDDDGTGLYSTGLGHGDALHVSDLDPERPGLEVFNIQERFDDAGANFRDAASGEILWKIPSVKAAESGGDRGEGPGRGVAINIDPRHPGAECWVFGAGITGLYNAKGEMITETTPSSCNFAIWWDGDLQREILDRNFISKWNWEQERLEPLLTAEECESNNGTKANPALSADLFGDWREEVIWRTKDNSELRIYTTTIPTEHRFPTLMHDPVYRLGIAWQNVAYNQPPHTSYYIGEDMETPPRPEIDIIEATER